MKFGKMTGLSAYLVAMMPVFASAVELEVDPAHSAVGFDVKHLVVSTVRGNFTDFSGSINLDEKDFTKSKLYFKVKTDSISTANAKRDEHLRSPDFFDTKKYPEATFTATSIQAAGKNTYKVDGDLNLHGITKKAQFTLVSLGKVKDPYGAEKSIYRATTVLERKDFGLTYNAALEGGGVVIGEKVNLTIDVEAAPKAVAKAE